MKGIQLEYASVITVIKIFRSACYISQILMHQHELFGLLIFIHFSLLHFLSPLKCRISLSHPAGCGPLTRIKIKPVDLVTAKTHFSQTRHFVPRFLWCLSGMELRGNDADDFIFTASVCLFLPKYLD